MADLAKLVVSLEANQSKLIRGLDDTNKRIRAFQQRTDSSLKKVDKAFAGASRGVNILKGALAAVGAGAAIRGIINIADSYAQIEGRLGLVTKSSEQLSEVQSELFAIAQRTRKEYQATANLYVSLGQAADELGASQQQLLKFTEGVGNALTVAGSSAQSASGALLQLGQLIGGTVVQAQEFNSLIDGARPILVAVANGVERFGGSVSKLREEIKKGTFTSREFFDGFLVGSEDLAKQAESLQRTVSQSVVQLRNQFEKTISEIDLSALVDGFDDLKDTVSDPKVSAGLQAIAAGLVLIAAAAAKVLAVIGNVATDIGTFIGESLAKLTGAFSTDIKELEADVNRLRASIAVGFDPFGIQSKRLAKLEPVLKLFKDLEQGANNARTAVAEIATENIKPIGVDESVKQVEKLSSAAKAAASEIQNALESLRNLEVGLKQDFESAGLEGAALLEYRLSVGDLSDELKKAGSAGREAAEGALAYQRAIDESAKIEEHRIQLLEEESKQMEEIKSLYERHREAITGVDSTTQAFKDTIFDLNRLLAAGRINYDQYTQAVFRTQDAFDEARKSSEENANQVTKFAESAAQGIQQAFADFFFDPFDQGLKGLLENLQRTLDRAAAEILASQLSGFLFGNQAGSTSSGFGGGFLGKIGGAIAGVFGGGGSTAVASDFGHVQGFAHGGRYSANEPRIVGEFGPELDIPDHSGRIIPNNQLGGGMSVTINQSVTVADGGTLSPRSRHQIANETAIGVQRALARHNGR